MVAEALARHDGASAAAHVGGGLLVQTSQGSVVLTHYGDFSQVRDLWCRFEQDAVCSHAQIHAWAEAWHRLIELPVGNEAAIIVGRGTDGRPLFIWPFTVRTQHRLRVLSWVSQAHANYNMGLYARDFAAGLEKRDVRALLAAAARLARASLASFVQQPREWEGLRNPLALIPHQKAPSSGHAVTLQANFDAIYKSRFGKATRNSLQRKERKMSLEGEVEYGWADSLGARLDVLEAFLEQKAHWFAEAGIANDFADSRYRAFYRAMAAVDGPEDGRMQLGYMRVGGEIVATLIGVPHRKRFTILLSSITPGDLRRWSPGLLVMRAQIQDLCRRGFDVYDLGVGENRTKSEWSDHDIPLFDTHIGFTPLGHVFAVPRRAWSTTKRIIKSQPQLWTMARRARRYLNALTAAPAR